MKRLERKTAAAKASSVYWTEWKFSNRPFTTCQTPTVSSSVAGRTGTERKHSVSQGADFCDRDIPPA